MAHFQNERETKGIKSQTNRTKDIELLFESAVFIPFQDYFFFFAIRKSVRL